MTNKKKNMDNIKTGNEIFEEVEHYSHFGQQKTTGKVNQELEIKTRIGKLEQHMPRSKIFFTWHYASNRKRSLGITWRDQKTNEWIRQRTQAFDLGSLWE